MGAPHVLHAPHPSPSPPFAEYARHAIAALKEKDASRAAALLHSALASIGQQ